MNMVLRYRLFSYPDQLIILVLVVVTKTISWSAREQVQTYIPYILLYTVYTPIYLYLPVYTVGYDTLI